jgi:hypothetical protein
LPICLLRDNLTLNSFFSLERPFKSDITFRCNHSIVPLDLRGSWVMTSFHVLLRLTVIDIL